MPIEVWQRMIETFYPSRGWIPAGEGTIERLRRIKLEHGLPSYEAARERLLDDR